MINNLKNLIKDKKVLLLGFGREGKSTYNLLKKIGGYKEIAISDKNEVVGIEEKTYTGDTYQDAIKNYDIVFKSPGVVISKNIELKNTIITSQIEQFLKIYGGKTIGITGTKGKSTVSSLISHVLKYENKDVIFAGNIGVPVFDVIDSIKDSTIIVIELSCHQLENCKYSPHIAVFLNIYEDHLDHYDSFNEYYNAKKNIYKNQKSDDILYCIEQVKPETNACRSVIKLIDKEKAPFKTFSDISATNFRGDHNVLNCAFAYEVVKDFDVKKEKFIEAVKSFKTLPHRLEKIASINGVDYFDDSISTTVESTISAIKSIDNISTILLGGLDRGINYDKLIIFLKTGVVKNVICMYASGFRIYENIKNTTLNKYYCEDLETAVKKAKEVTKNGEACVLSPASASYGDFKNFEERGDKFKEFIYKV